MNRPNITVVFNNAVRCSGFCGFCTAARIADYNQGFNNNDLASIRNINEQLNNLIKWDYDALEKRIVEYPGWKESTSFNISAWGADPLTSFDQFVELYEFCTDIAKRNNKVVTFSGSTNGMAFSQDDWVEWLLNRNNITMQISHDGCGQWMRTLDHNPLEWENTLKLFRHGMLNYISCVLNFWNSSPMSNIKYFENNIPADIYNKIQIRLYTVRDAPYDVSMLNYKGMLNDKTYDQLKGLKLGDMCIRNDETLAKETGVWQLAHQADDYFDEIEQIYKSIDNSRYDPYRSVLIQRVAYNAKQMHGYVREGIPNYQRPWCAQYHTGQRDNSNCIDTLGKFTPCHLYDSNMNVPNPNYTKPERCNSCKYKDCWECNVCGAMELSPNYCQWNYRFQQQMQRLQHSKWIMDWVKLYNSGKRNLRNKRIH